MKLSPAFIIQRLSDTYEIIYSGQLSKEPCLDKLYFYTVENPLMENTLYLLDSSHQLPRKTPIPTNSLLLQIQDIPETPRTLPANFCLLKNASSILSLFNQIQDLFQSLEQWRNDLICACLKGASIQRLLEISQPVLNAPLAVMDSYSHLIASAPAWEPGHMTDAFNAFKEKIRHCRISGQDDYVSEAGLFCVNIGRQSSMPCQLFMLKKDPKTFCEHYDFLLEYLAEMIQYAFTHNTMLHSLFQTILAGKSINHTFISQQLDALGWRFEDHYICIILEDSHMNAENPDLRSICSYIENSMPWACAFIYKNNIVIYINQSKAQLTVSAISEKLAYFIRDQLLKAGYSRCMPGHMDLYEQYVQAHAALEMGKCKRPSLWIHHFNEIALDYILEEATKKLPGYMISHEKLLKLKYIDNLHHTEYVKTLRCYLNNHCNAVQTAKALYIHRSTFLYRLDKIKDILHTDLNNPDETLYLMLSLHFIEMEEKDAPYAFTSTLS